jgi:hypothetical protein
MSAQYAPMKERVPGFARTSRNLFVLPGKNTRAREDKPNHKLVRFGENLLYAARQYRDGEVGMKALWRSYRDWYLGAGSSGSLTYQNMIFETIEKLSADLTDSRPSFLFEPNRIQDLPMTDFLAKAVPWVWDQHDLQSMYYETVKGTLIYGTWYWKAIHDPRFSNQGGVERTQSIAPWYIFPAPYATNPDEAPWIIQVMPRTVGEIFNDYGVRVNPEMTYGNHLVDDGGNQFGNRGGSGFQQFTTVATNEYASSGVPDWSGGSTYDTAGGGVVTGLPDSFMAGLDRDGVVLQKELWIRDGSTVEGFAFQDDAYGLPQLMRTYNLRFPKGRVISWANGKLLYDVENPYQDGRFPYVQFKDVTIPDFWYGMGEVQQQVNLQLLHNDTHEIIKQIHMFTAVGRTIVDKGTGLTPERMGNRPGDIWFTLPGTSDRVKHLQAQAPHAEFYQYMASLKQASDLMSGTFDPARGINPSGVHSGKAFQTLQSAAGIRVKARYNDLERALTGWAKRSASRVQQFWPSETALRVTGTGVPDDSAFSVFRMRPDDRNAAYTVRVSSTANLDSVKQGDFQKLILLAQAGIPIPPEILLKVANLSNQKEIEAMMARMPRMPTPQETGSPRGGQGVGQ